MRRPVTLGLAVAVAVIAAGCSGPLVVEEVMSGDQVRLSSGRIFKYAGIVAPGASDPFFEDSRRANADLVLGKVVEVVEDPESDEGYVYTPVKSGERTQFLFVNRELVLFGFARVREDVGDPARRDLAQSLQEAQEEARSEALGIWGTGE